MIREQIIRFKADAYELTGTLHLPDAQRPPLIIGCHGLLADRSSAKQRALAQACTRQGMAYFRFDHRGCGESQGQWEAVTSLPARCADLGQAMAAMHKHPGVGPLAGLFGSSFGGTVVLSVAAQQQIPSLVTYAAPISSDFMHGRPSKIAAFSPHVEKGLAFDITPSLGTQHTILVIHGDNDAVVPIDHAYQIYKHARQPKQLIVQTGGDHPMSNPDHQEDFIQHAVSWFQQSKR